MTARGWFVAGTDTGVGKTRISAAWIRALVRSGYRVAGMKPVATGCEGRDGLMRSPDADQLIQSANVQAAYADVSPFRYQSPTAPTLALRDAENPIEIDAIAAAYERLAALAEVVVVEGVGGWLVPINDRLTMADVVLRLGIPVVLVVGIRLGAINHALLTLEAIRSRGALLAGWIGNHADGVAPPDYVSELSRQLGQAPLAVIPPNVSAVDCEKRLAAIDIQSFPRISDS